MPGSIDDVMLNKAAIIERALKRMKEEYAADPELRNFTHIDALTLNIQRACQAAIDLALHLVATNRLGMPQTSAEAFTLLSRAQLLDEALARSLAAMTAFRNIAIHEYQALDKEILKRIATEQWKDLILFGKVLGLKIQP